MYGFSERSKQALATCTRELQDIMRIVGRRFNIRIMEGYRDEERQEKLFRRGRTQVHYPKGKHNKQPSEAVDFVPGRMEGGEFVLDWIDREQFTVVAGYAMGVASGMGLKLRWGGNWKGDGYLKNNLFDDLGHLELEGI